MDKCHKQYQLFQSADFIKNEKCPQTLSTTLIKVAMFWKMFSKAVYYFSKKSLWILFPKKLHLKFIRMKLLNRKNEARNSIKNINERSFVVQQEYLLAHFWDWWEDFEENLALELKIFNDSHKLFSVLQNRTNSLRVQVWNDSFPQLSGFEPIIMAPEFTESGIVRKATVTNG